jgi:hypothetical protein
MARESHTSVPYQSGCAYPFRYHLPITLRHHGRARGLSLPVCGLAASGRGSDPSGASSTVSAPSGASSAGSLGASRARMVRACSAFAAESWTRMVSARLLASRSSSSCQRRWETCSRRSSTRSSCAVSLLLVGLLLRAYGAVFLPRLRPARGEADAFVLSSTTGGPTERGRSLYWRRRSRRSARVCLLKSRHVVLGPPKRSSSSARVAAPPSCAR